MGTRRSGMSLTFRQILNLSSLSRTTHEEDDDDGEISGDLECFLRVLFALAP